MARSSGSLLGLHTTHIITDLADTLVLAALMFTRHGDNKRRFGDVQDNAHVLELRRADLAADLCLPLLGAAAMTRLKDSAGSAPGPASCLGPGSGP